MEYEGDEEQIVQRFRAMTPTRILITVDVVLDLLDSGSFSKDKMSEVKETYDLFHKIKNGNKIV
jgi:hypothetical protein